MCLNPWVCNMSQNGSFWDLKYLLACESTKYIQEYIPYNCNNEIIYIKLPSQFFLELLVLKTQITISHFLIKYIPDGVPNDISTKKPALPWDQPSTAATKDSSGSRAQAEPTTVCKWFSSQDLF